MLNKFSKFLVNDIEKQVLIDDILSQQNIKYMKHHVLRSPQRDLFDMEMDYCEDTLAIAYTKFCPICHREYSDEENICYNCLTTLKPISEKKPVIEIQINPVFSFNGKNNYESFEDILTMDNLESINEFQFSPDDYAQILKNIKKTALTNLDEAIKANYVDLNNINVYEKVLLFTKSFVNVSFKSYGQELGYYEFNNITIDDRQLPSLEITTLIHELSHFLLKEILTQSLCKLLDCNKNIKIECIIDYILSYSNFTRLVDEYSAHCCEGRFTVYGYQDYSSFLNIIAALDGEMSKDEIEITKSIGNTFANSIKEILETFIDHDLLDDIKHEFLRYHIENPNYDMLKLENCEKLTSEGFLKAIWLILIDGFKVAIENVSKLNEYYGELG